ncbi:hypothetical protein RKD47_006603 [Streptomyces albogriseolus]
MTWCTSRPRRAGSGPIRRAVASGSRENSTRRMCSSSGAGAVSSRVCADSRAAATPRQWSASPSRAATAGSEATQSSYRQASGGSAGRTPPARAVRACSRSSSRTRQETPSTTRWCTAISRWAGADGARRSRTSTARTWTPSSGARLRSASSRARSKSASSAMSRSHRTSCGGYAAKGSAAVIRRAEGSEASPSGSGANRADSAGCAATTACRARRRVVGSTAWFSSSSTDWFHWCRSVLMCRKNQAWTGASGAARPAGGGGAVRPVPASSCPDCSVPPPRRVARPARTGWR